MAWGVCRGADNVCVGGPDFLKMFPIYKVYSPLLLVLCKEIRNLAFLLNIFLKKACVTFKNVLPLHPLSGTKLPVSDMKEFIERFT